MPSDQNSNSDSARAASRDAWTRRQFAALPLLAGAAAHGEPVAPGRSGRKWEIFVVQHSHIDVGYTHNQEVIADFHAQFLNQAVDFALSPAQAARPADARFKWTCEGFWAVEQFLERAPAAQKARLVRAMKEGLIELTAAYFHMTELPDMELLRRNVSYSVEFAKREGVPLNVAMDCDINGVSWGMADAYAEAGVKYFSMNTNPEQGGYPFGHPLVPFYWESPAGKRVLAWSGLAYHKANLFGLMGGVAPDRDPGIPGFSLPFRGPYTEVRDISFAERRLMPYLNWLESTNYPHPYLLLTGSGVYTDNSPAGDEGCRIIADWNSKHGERVHIRTATLAEYFAHIEKNTPNLPVHRGEWTDWWSDGAASTPVDTLVYRNALRTRRTVEMLDPAHEAVSGAELAAIDKKLLLYCEHTFGYSHTDATSLLVQQVFGRKSKHAIDADELAGAAMVKTLRRSGEGSFAARRPFEYTVINPLTERVHSVAYLPLDSWEAPTAQAPFHVVDENGRTVPHQLESRPRGWNAAVDVDLAPQQRLRFKLVPGGPQAGAPALASTARSFENEFYRAVWTERKGITELTGAHGVNVLDPAVGALGSPVYQIFPGGNRGDAGTTSGQRVRPHDTIAPGTCTAIKRVAAGKIYERWELHYDVPGASRYILYATFFHHLPQFQVTASMVKTDVRDPEGMYVLFPFAEEEGVWSLDKPGGPIRPKLDQLPQACSDYYSIQHGAALAGKRHGVALATLDAPLVDIGAIRLWNYSTGIEPTGPLYSWVTNNKWHTNFRLTCGGSYEFRYLVQLAPEFADAHRAIACCRTLSYPPIVVRA
jgi:hypothetical protein